MVSGSLKIRTVIASRCKATAWQSPYRLCRLNFSGSLKIQPITHFSLPIIFYLCYNTPQVCKPFE